MNEKPARHSSREMAAQYRPVRFDFMNHEEAKTHVGPGWQKLIDRYFGMLALFRPELQVEVVTVFHRSGMLQVKAISADPLTQNVLDAMEWRLERESARVCEVCGEKGYRRKLLNFVNRCTKHYIEQMNEEAPGLVL